MMDTILNLGLNDVAVEGLAAATGTSVRARLVPPADPDVRRGRRRDRRARCSRASCARSRSSAGVRQDVELTADDLRELVETYQAIYEREVG